MIDDAARRRRHRLERIIAATVIAAAATGLFLLKRYNDRMEAELRAPRVYVPLPAKITPEILLLRDYVRIDTSEREIDGARFLLSLLEKNGLSGEIIEPVAGRATLYARIRGRRSGEGLLLLHHIDVWNVAHQSWTKPPFAGEIALNMMYGRGTLDMKSIGLTHLLAFIDVARSGRQPERDLIFLAVADEERGSALGVRWLLEHRPDVFEGVQYALGEGGITEMTAERLVYYGIETGSKQTVNVVLRSDTREQMQRTRIALEPWIRRREPDRMLPEIRQYFRYVAPGTIAHREILNDIDAAIAHGKFWRLPPGYHELTQNNVTTGAVNGVEGGFEMSVQLRNLPDEIPENRVAWLRERIAPFGATIARIDRTDGPVAISSESTPLFALLRDAIRREYGEVRTGTVVLHRATNDLRFLRNRFPCYGLLPYPVSYDQSRSIHGTDERIRLDWYMQGISLMRRVVNAWAFGGTASQRARA